MPFTGRRIVTKLKEVNSVTGEETGNTMANVYPGPPYIEPYTDTVLCPVAYNTQCPVPVYATRTGGTTIEFEFNLPNSVVMNQQLDNLKVTAVGTSKSVSFSLGNKNFFHGVLSGLTSSKTYKISVEYYKGNTLMQTCYFETEY
jgi:hypothetical protein